MESYYVMHLEEQRDEVVENLRKAIEEGLDEDIIESLKSDIDYYDRKILAYSY